MTKMVRRSSRKKLKRKSKRKLSKMKIKKSMTVLALTLRSKTHIRNQKRRILTTKSLQIKSGGTLCARLL